MDRRFLHTALLVLISGSASQAQFVCTTMPPLNPPCITGVYNEGMERPLSTSAAGMLQARGFRHFNPSRRRFVGDVLTPPVLVRSGTASMETPHSAAFNFAGFDTDAFDSSPTVLAFYNPVYNYGCGPAPATWSVWVNVPASNPFKFKRAGQKWEFKRANTSVYEVFELFPIGPEINNNTGHTNGQWQQLTYTLTQADFDWKFNFYNDGPEQDGLGTPWPTPPIMADLVHAVFGTVPPGETETGTIFWDDITYAQPGFAAGDPVEFWDDLFVQGVAKVDATIPEPSIPVFLNGTRLGYPCLAGDDSFDIVDIFDQVSTTASFPLTWSEIVASGYVRPLVQAEDGQSAIGTSLIVQPSFKPAGLPLDLVPVMSRADVTARVRIPADRDLNAVPVLFGTALRTNNFKVATQGNYDGRATVTGQRDYSADPVPGTTTFTMTYTWTASQNITLDASATGRGFDAFRLATLSSMLANVGLGQYDARFVAVEDLSGNVRTVEVSETPRGVYLFAAPQPTGVGRSFWLYQDTGATFNPLSPSIEVELTSLTGAAGALGVQGFLSSSTNPNDDSLSLWLEWTGAPATINAGTQITATFTVRATDPTDVGDVDHDGDKDCTDVAALVALCGQSESALTFNAYADMNFDGQINAADREALELLTGACPASGCSAAPACPGDADGSGQVNFDDLTSVLGNFGVSTTPFGPGDADGNGAVNFDDITTVLANFGVSCS